MTSSFLGGIVTPPSSSFVTFWLPPPHRARNSRHTVYVGFLTTVEGPSQSGTASPATMNVTILSFFWQNQTYLQFYSEGRDDLKLG